VVKLQVEGDWFDDEECGYEEEDKCRYGIPIDAGHVEY
jgi:hypothetical protein